jgi:radical SAM methylthiotransferase, MiaB/RimO family
MKIFIKTFGCRVNQVESEAMLEEFISEGNIPVEDFKEADVCLLNTCTVTQNADRDAEREIRYITKHNPKAKIIVTGCYALAHKDELAAKFPFVQAVFKAEVGQKLFGKQFDWTVKEHEGKTRAFVKIQDGCNNFCSYCIVPYARPQKTSKPKPVVLNEVKNLLANGYKEIVLTGINVGNYLCPQTGADLAELTRGIVALEGNFRIRFSSIEINTVSDALVEVLASAGQKACNYFHLPLQSGSDAVLKNMRRRYSTEEYLKRVEEIKKRLFPIYPFSAIL